MHTASFTFKTVQLTKFNCQFQFQYNYMLFTTIMRPNTKTTNAKSVKEGKPKPETAARDAANDAMPQRTTR